MNELKMLDGAANLTVKHSVGFWAAVIAQWFFAIGAGVIALVIVTGAIVQTINGGDILMCLVVLPHLVFFTAVSWLSGKLAINIQSGIQPPSASLSLNWVSALSLTILTSLVGGISFQAIRQLRHVQEKARESEAIIYIYGIDSKQKAFSSKHGRLPTTISEIEPMQALRYFTLDYVTFENKSSSNWSTKLTRNDLNRSPRYGKYSIVYNSSGTPHFDCVDSTNLSACREELLPLSTSGTETCN